MSISRVSAALPAVSASGVCVCLCARAFACVCYCRCHHRCTPSCHSIAPSLCSGAHACSLLLSPFFLSPISLCPSLFPSQFVIDPAAPSPWQRRQQAFLLPRAVRCASGPRSAPGGWETQCPLCSAWQCCVDFSGNPRRGSLDGSELLDLRSSRSG